MKLGNMFFLGLLIGLPACQAPSKASMPESRASVSGTNVQDSGSAQVAVTYQKPENLKDPWTRVLELRGVQNVNQRAVDMQLEGDLNWTVIGITNESGVYYHLNADKKVRYRLSGVFETEWLEPVNTTFISSETDFSSRKITGRMCVIEKNQVIYIASESLHIECTEVLLEGDIRSFSGSAANHHHGAHSGNLKIVADTLNVSGRIHLVGQAGNGQIWGQMAATNGGNGGIIEMQYRNRDLMPPSDAFLVDGGSAGSFRIPLGRNRDYVGTPGLRGEIRERILRN